MTTSYILERQEDLKAHKKMMREAEKAAVEKMEEEKELRQAANEARIKAKVERIARGDALRRSRAAVSDRGTRS